MTNENIEIVEIEAEETEVTTDMVAVEDGSIDEDIPEATVGQKVAMVAGITFVGAVAYKYVLKPVGKKIKSFGEKVIIKLADRIKSKAEDISEADLDECVEVESTEDAE